MRPETDRTDALDRAAPPCEDCTRTTRWERREVSEETEAFLGTCFVCGSIRVMALGAEEIEIEDPLAFYLLGVPKFEPAPETPAWQRFYARTLEAPFNLRWRFAVDPCIVCAASACVGATLFTLRGHRTLELCLSCGAVCVETTIASSGMVTRMEGASWAPPDPAVKTLRDSIFEPYRRWATSYDEWRRQNDDQA